jgi:hypothetical protein
MPSYATRVKQRTSRRHVVAAPRDMPPDEVYARRNELPRVEPGGRRARMLRDPRMRPLGPQGLVVPTRQGMMSGLEYRMELEAERLKRQAMVDVIAFQEHLDKGEWETVHHPYDEPYRNKLQGAEYHIGPRETKKLPSPLAAHYRMKMSYADAQQKQDLYTGLLRPGQDVPEPLETMRHEEFKARVKAYDQTIANNLDIQPRKKVY